MRNLKRKHISGSFVCWILVFLILVLFSVCKSREKAKAEEEAEKEEKGAIKIISVEELVLIFGKAKSGNSGVADVDQTDKEILISYHFSTEDLSQFDKDLGMDLAPKIQKFYKEFKTPDRVAFRVYVPHLAENPWRPYIFFVVTRKLIKETNWTGFLESDFLRVVEELKYYD